MTNSFSKALLAGSVALLIGGCASTGNTELMEAVDSANATASAAYNTANEALDMAAKAQETANRALEMAQDAKSVGTDAQQTANQALEEARQASEKADRMYMKSIAK